MRIRLFRPQDADQIAQLFHDTVREINCQDYSSTQVKAWAPDDIYFKDWVQACGDCFTYVADQNGAIAGFAQLEPNGHIDCFYCHQHYQRQGVGRQLYDQIEAKALELGLNRLFTEASVTAKPFFQHLGFSVIKQQQVTCRGETLKNYQMEKLFQRTVE